ncbi:MAG: putative bifunctional diguanylate cyclase/phosphodiesterase [Candidatus Limnocylindrales bacterium]
MASSERDVAAAPASGASLRSVALGVIVAVIAAAAAPVVVVLGFLPALAGAAGTSGPPSGTAAQAVVAGVTEALQDIGDAASNGATDAALRQQLAAGGGASPLPAASTVLDSTATAAGPGVVRLALVDAAGTPRLTWEGGVVRPGGSSKPPLTAKPGGAGTNGSTLAVSKPFAGPDGDHEIALAAPVAASGATKAGSLVAWVSLDALLRAALARAGSAAGGTVGAAQLTDSSGILLGDSRPGSGTDALAALPAASLLTLALPASGPFPAWQLRVSGAAPGVQHELAPAAFWSLVILLGALFLAALWGLIQVLRPAHELAASRAELQRLYHEAMAHAYVDVMTGLGNQRAFQEEFDRQLELARRERFPVSLLVVDLDDFKRVNDSEGHAAGDALLARFARILEGCIRRSDQAFRMGGDEFAVVMPGTDLEGADILARRILGAALEPDHTASPHSGISFSGGISAAPNFGQTRVELFTQADAALYWSKRHGRTTVTAYDPRLHHAAVGAGSSAFELAAAVATVVEQRTLRAVFQPIVELATGRVIGYEGLVRPTGAPFVDPGSLFAAAEAGGRTVELDRACLETVAQAAAVISPDQYVAINLSPRTLEAPEFNALALCRQLARLGLPAQRIVLELTEREAVEDLPRLRRNLEACRALGVRVAADDVGAGNSGLRLLSLVPFDVVKIDLSLVQDAATHQTSAEVLETLRELAQRRGATVIAEGLETTQQLRTVIAAGIDAAQGYLLGRPGDAVDMAWLDLKALIAADRSRRSVSLLGPDASAA